MPNFRARKFREKLSGRDTRELHESSDCFEYPKNSLLKLTTQKNTCQNFPTQKVLRSSLSLSHLKCGVSPLGLEPRAKGSHFSLCLKRRVSLCTNKPGAHW